MALPVSMTRLTDDEIQAAECVIVAVDRSIRWRGSLLKRLIMPRRGDAVRDADRLLEEAGTRQKAPVYRGGPPSTSDWKELGQSTATGERHLPHPAVCCGGRRDAGAFPAAAARFLAAATSPP